MRVASSELRVVSCELHSVALKLRFKLITPNSLVVTGHWSLITAIRQKKRQCIKQIGASLLMFRVFILADSVLMKEYKLLCIITLKRKL